MATANKTKSDVSVPATELTVTDTVTAPSLLSGDDARKAMEDFFGDDPKYIGTMTSFPVAIVLNGSDATFGIFLKEDEMQRAGWKTDLSHNGEKRLHQFRSGSKEKKPGLLFRAPFVHIIDQSGRWIEIKRNERNGDLHPELGKSGTIIGEYADRNGRIDPVYAAAYEKLKVDELATLRTIYLIRFVNESGQSLHDIPFALSIHGTTAVEFSKAIDTVRVSAFSKPLSPEAFSLLVWKPVFAADLVGSGDKQSYCTIISKDDSGKLQQDFAIPSNPKELEEEFNAIREANGNFAWRFFESNEYHPFAKALTERTNLLAVGFDEYDLPINQDDPSFDRIPY
jgi:hypothetical protein